MSKISQITKRSGTGILRNSTRVVNSQQWSTVVDNLVSDISELVSEHNNKVKAVFDGLARGADDSISGLDSTYDAIARGLDGTVEFTDRRATSSDPSYLYSTELARALTLKESIVQVYTLLSESIDSIVIPDTDVISDYTKEYIGEKAFDSNLTSGPTSIDARLADLEDNILTTYTNKLILYGDGTTVPQSASGLYWNPTFSRFGIGVATPGVPLDVSGKIRHSEGVISSGGATRGTEANDFQNTRSASSQVASGNYSFLAGGNGNTASGANSFAANNKNESSGSASFTCGSLNTASATASFASGYQSSAPLDYSKAHAAGAFAIAGDAQVLEVVCRNETTGAGTFELSVDGAGGHITLTDQHSYGVVAHVVCKSNGGESNFYVLEGLIERGAGAGTTAIIGSVTKRTIAEELVALDVTLTADAVNGALTISVTGSAGATTRWVANVTLIEVGY